ncbi:hypothetical protein [Streptomyces mangrovisoli]|uniref:DUF4386 domain-containing protein n=1 Tax=Streptomyces mangrovisoli TaxID=1428628 RepID=A0A1J4NSV9_9ACTN|nr:hypothetical protein [Streptomyces mangrovisoli]OIJ65511.1 hypothetical protein WN71_023500 [Streptomyces mangrovisoli]
MHETMMRRLTGVSGIAAAAAFIVEVPLYFLYSGPPPDANVLSRLLIGILGLGCLIVFMAALRELVAVVRSDTAWAGSLALVSGLAYAIVTLVSSGLEAGAVIAADRPVDPTVAVDGTYILYGTVSRMLAAMFLTATAYAISRTGLLPRWTSRTAYALAAVDLAFMPSLFFGNTPARFYAANGWGTTALTGALLSYWLLAVGITTLRSASRAPRTLTPPAHPRPIRP